MSDYLKRPPNDIPLSEYTRTVTESKGIKQSVIVSDELTEFPYNI